jgi:phage terminase large subunit
MLQEKINLLIVRATAKTNRDSTFALMKQVISKWKLSQYFKVNESDLRIKCLLNGNEIIFAGLDDVEKLKSITFANGELTDIWIEEASEVLESDFNQLDIRLRGGSSKKQIILSFNPVNINHWIKRNLIDTLKATFVKTTYKNNKFLDEDYKKLLESYKDTDPYYYTVYCLGEWGTSGKTIFDAEKVQNRIFQVGEPLKQGSFLYDYDGLKITNIRWQEDKQGYIKIYKDVEARKPYVIGGDTAGEGSDNFIGQVLDNTTGEQVAVLKHQFDEDLYAKQMYCLGEYYNTALIGIEANYSTYPIMELERLGYRKMFYRQTEDTITHKIERRFGFKTTSLTRPIILAELVKIVRENIEVMLDRATLEEMQTFVRNEKGRPEAELGCHDDLIMALAIAHYIRTQQSMTIPVIPHDPIFNFDFEKPKKDPVGKGDKITVI